MSVIAEIPPGIVSGGPFSLHRSTSVYDVCRQVSDRPANFNILTRRILRSEHPPTTPWETQGRMGEHHVADALQNLSGLYGGRLNLTPEPNPHVDTGYDFRRSPDGNVTVYKVGSGDAVVEVDGVFDFDGIKVAYDVKTSLLKDHTADALTDERIDQIVNPMHRIFKGSPIALVLFTPVETIEQSAASPVLTELDDFVMAGGVVASIPSLVEFREAAQAAYTQVSVAA